MTEQEMKILHERLKKEDPKLLSVMEKCFDAGVLSGKEQAQRTWVEPREWRGLTDEEILSWWSMDNDLEDLDMCSIIDFRRFVEEVEAKLKKKNT